MKINAAIQNFIPSNVSTDIEQIRLAHIQVKFILISLFIDVSYWVVSFYINFVAVQYVTIFSFFFLFGLLLAFKWGLSLKLTTHLFVFYFWLVVIIVTSFSGGIQSYVLAWIALIPIMAITLLSNKAAWGWGIMGVLTVVAFYTIKYDTLIPNYLIISENNLWNASLHIGLQFFILILTYIFGRHQHELIEKIEQQNQLISKQKNTYKSNYDNVKLLGEIGAKITASLDVKEIILNVYSEAKNLLPADRFNIGLYNEEKNTLEFTGNNAKELANKNFSYHIDSDSNRLAVQSFNEKKLVVTNNLLLDNPNYPKAAIGELPASVVVAPLIQKNNVLGIITVCRLEANSYTDYHIQIIQNLAVYIAIALENAKTYESLEKSFDQIDHEEKKNSRLTKHQNFLKATIEMMRDLMGKTDLYEIAWSITQTLKSIYDLEDCVIYIVKNNSCHQIAASGPKNPSGKIIYNPITVELGSGVVGTVAKTGISENIKDTSNDPRYIADDIPRLSELSIPIFSGEKVIGVIDSENSSKNFFTDDHLSTFTTIADLISLMIENALILEEQNERQRQLTIDNLDISKEKDTYKSDYENIIILSEIGSGIISTLSIETIISRVYKNVNRLMPAEVFTLGIHNKEKNTLDFVGGMEKNEMLGDFSYHLEEDSERHHVLCFKNQEVIITNNQHKDYPNYPKPILGENALSVIYVPLFLNTQIVGVLGVCSFNKNAYTEYHLSILQNLAVYISIAIENAQTFEKLNRSYAQLKELDKYKESMTAMIVHDFKNSLNTVISFSEGTPTERRLKSIRQAGQFMLNMVLNILDVQKFETANVKISLANYSVSKLIVDALDQLSYMLEQKSIKLTYEPKEQLYFRVDFELITRLLVNILSNALKYVPINGKIEIKTVSQHGFIHIAIKDNGQGIPADKLHMVFDKYSQINAQKSGSVRSTGIGLTFCKMVVEAHDGEIGVESEEGKGSTFWFTLRNGDTLVESKEEKVEINVNSSMDPIIEFNKKDNAILQPFINQLYQWEVYDFSEVKAILASIEVDNSTAIATWLDEMNKALQNVNEEMYEKLIKQVLR